MTKRTSLGAWLAVIVVTFTVVGILLTSSQEKIQQKNEIVADEVYLATSSLPIKVSGVVEAADAITIYAKTAGVVTAIPYKEGAVVAQGTVLSLQDAPVDQARVVLAQAEAALSASSQRAGVSARRAENEKAILRSYSASEIAALRADSNDNRLMEVTEQTSATIKTNVATILSALDYINNNRSLFTAEGIREYNKAVRLTYGNRQTHFDTNFLTGGTVKTSETLKSLSAQSDASAIDAENAAASSVEILSLINNAFISAEKEVFDRGNNQLSEEKSAYLEQKTAVTNSLLAVDGARNQVQQTIDSSLVDAATQGLSVAVSDVDRVEAANQAALALEIQARVADVSNAAVGIAVAQVSLGVALAPFGGEITRVFVNEGEYVMPGTPLLQLTGIDAKELLVTVPDTMASQITKGQSFFIGDKLAGTVDRFSTVPTGHGIRVIIALYEDGLAVGTTARGYIVSDSATNIYKVPRAYVHFRSEGVRIMYRDGMQTPVEIVYDSGEYLFLSVEDVRSEPLIPATQFVR